MTSKKLKQKQNRTKINRKQVCALNLESSECKESGLRRPEFKGTGFPRGGEKKMAQNVDTEQKMVAAYPPTRIPTPRDREDKGGKKEASEVIFTLFFHLG